MKMDKVSGTLFVVVSTLVTWVHCGPLRDRDPPNLPNFYWGPKERQSQKEDTSIRPFEINIPEKVLLDLKTRLVTELSEDGNRLTPPLEGIGFQYGFNTNALKNITSHWLQKYNWRTREKILNRYPQFMTSIAGINIHFQHVKSLSKKGYKKARPLLLLHGWPGSFVEFQKVIPLLTDPDGSGTTFELVIPSLPGFGFSEGAHRPGLGPVEMAQIFQKLMKRLGYDKFYVQGGDWGSAIATNMAALYPENVKGVHVNLCLSPHRRTILRMLVASIFPSLFRLPQRAPRLFPLSSSSSRLLEEGGYFHIQATKPDTIGVALSNSPSGLAAYILEKFSTGTNIEWTELEDGGLLPYYDIDQLLDNVMVYWVTNSITTSMRLYAEVFPLKAHKEEISNVPVKVPTGCLSLPQEFLNIQNEYFIRDKYHQLLSFTRGSKGGHFAAFEVPTILATNLHKFFNLVENTRPS